MTPRPWGIGARAVSSARNATPGTGRFQGHNATARGVIALRGARAMARRRTDDPPPPDDDALPQDPTEVEGDPGAEPAAADPAAPRRPKPVDAAIVALFAPGELVEHETIAAAQRAWREATQREAPSVERLAEKGTVTRVDADLASGYVAVVTADDTWRAFLPREQFVLVVALILRRPLREVASAFARGPGSLAPEG